MFLVAVPADEEDVFQELPSFLTFCAYPKKNCRGKVVKVWWMVTVCNKGKKPYGHHTLQFHVSPS